MRLALLPLAALAGLLAPLPAWAQESAGVCPNVVYAVSQEQRSGPAGEPVTLTFASDVGPARTPDRWTLTQVAPGPERLLQTAPSAPSATFTITADETSTYRITAEGPDGCGPASAEFTRTVTAPSPRPTPTSDPACATTTVDVPRGPVLSGQEVRVRVLVRDVPATSTVVLYRDSPAPRQAVRSAHAVDGEVTWTLRLGETHTLRAAADSPAGCLSGQQGSAVVPVRALVSLTAARRAPRQYLFSGRVQPAYGTVALYRVGADGRRVLTARTDVLPDGTWRVARRFTGTGRFGFLAVADAGSTGRYTVGESPVRPVLVS